MSLRNNLFMVALGLGLLGVTMVYSATVEYYGAVYLVKQAIHLALGIGVFFLVRRVSYTGWRRLTPWVYGLSVVTLLLVLIPGVGIVVGGARRWLDLGIFSLQPAEFAKLAAVIVLSCAVSRGAAVRGDAGLKEVAKPLGAIGFLFLLIILEPDFGTSAVLLVGVAGVLWASELRTRGLVVAGALGGTALAAVMMAQQYRRERFFTFLNPWASPQGDGYQTVQAMTAIKSGGLLGSGPGAGDLGHTVPEIGTDMIFALIGEELGLPGMLAVILGFCFIGLAGFRIALHAPSVLGRCLAAGISTLLVVQATFNMGATLGVLPLSGMTLPFISSGGSSVVVSFAAVGILYRISEDSERAREAKPRSGRRQSRREPRRESQRAGGSRSRGPGAAGAAGAASATGPDRGRRYGGARDSRTVRSG